MLRAGRTSLPGTSAFFSSGFGACLPAAGAAAASTVQALLPSLCELRLQDPLHAQLLLPYMTALTAITSLALDRTRAFSSAPVTQILAAGPAAFLPSTFLGGYDPLWRLPQLVQLHVVADLWPAAALHESTAYGWVPRPAAAGEVPPWFRNKASAAAHAPVPPPWFGEPARAQVVPPAAVAPIVKLLDVLAARWCRLQFLHLPCGLDISSQASSSVLPALSRLVSEGCIADFAVIASCMPALVDLSYAAQCDNGGPLVLPASSASGFQKVCLKLRRLCMMGVPKAPDENHDIATFAVGPALTSLELHLFGEGSSDVMAAVASKASHVKHLCIRDLGVPDGVEAEGAEGGGLRGQARRGLQLFDDGLLHDLSAFACLDSLHLDMACPPVGAVAAAAPKQSTKTAKYPLITAVMLEDLVCRLAGRGLRKLVLSGFAWAANGAYLGHRQRVGRVSQAWLWAELAPRYPLLEIVVEP
jgi:hypothetical protein